MQIFDISNYKLIENLNFIDIYNVFNQLMYKSRRYGCFKNNFTGLTLSEVFDTNTFENMSNIGLNLSQNTLAFPNTFLDNGYDIL